MATVIIRNGVDVGALVETIEAIRAKASVRATGASEEELRDLCAYVQKTSPVRDVLANGVPVKTTIEVKP